MRGMYHFVFLPLPARVDDYALTPSDPHKTHPIQSMPFTHLSPTKTLTFKKMLDSLSPSKEAQPWLTLLQSRKNFISAPVWVALTPWQWASHKHTSQRDPVGIYSALLAPTQRTFNTHPAVTQQLGLAAVTVVSSAIGSSTDAEAPLAWAHLNLVHAELRDCRPSDVVPAAAAKQIVFLVLFVYTVTEKVTGLAESDLWPGTSDSLLVLNVLQTLILALFLFCFIGEIMTLRLVQPPVYDVCALWLPSAFQTSDSFLAA